MNTLREEHEKLELKTRKRFEELLNIMEKDVDILSEKEDYYDCDIVDIFDEVMGGSYSIYVVKITKEGLIEGVDSENGGSRTSYKFSNLASLMNKIGIIEIIEENL